MSQSMGGKTNFNAVKGLQFYLDTYLLTKKGGTDDFTEGEWFGQEISNCPNREMRNGSTLPGIMSKCVTKAKKIFG